MKIKIKRVDKTLPLPEYQTNGAVAFDLYARASLPIPPGEIRRIPTNIIVEIPVGFMLLIKDRSSLAKKKGLLCTIGFIDQDFRGENDEILLQVYNFTDNPVVVQRGERLGQGAFMPIAVADWEEVDQMNAPDRGGFGTTGII
jgi:dUTP pyrophosphatase